MTSRVFKWLAMALLLAGSVNFVAAQATSQPPAGTAAPTVDHEKKHRIKRWFEFDQLSVATRYHLIENDLGQKTSNNDQYQFVAKFRFKFDKKEKYSVAANLATGPLFTTFWNISGWGTGRHQTSLNFRQLYFIAKPAKAIEVQVGGLYVNMGENTEAVTYDNDGYVTGERVQVRAPKRLYFDEVSVTYGRLADVAMPNVFDRFKRFDKQNYHQFLVRKQVTKQVFFSADYTFESGIDTLHQAIRIKLPKKQFIDTLLFENYQRLDPNPDYGFNVFGEKKLGKMFTASGGYADINIVALNSDRFPPGKRIYLTGQIKLSPEFGISVQFTQGVGQIFPLLSRTRLDVAFQYNILETLRRTKFF